MALASLITRDELKALAAPNKSLDSVSTADQDDACLAASGVAYSYLRQRFEPPYTSVGKDVKMHTAWIATYFLLGHKNTSPAYTGDQYTLRYNAAIKWFTDCSRGTVTPELTDAEATTTGGAYIVTTEPRGW
jgi:phage gp36-like protein